MKELEPPKQVKLTGHGRAAEENALKGVLGIINSAEFSETDGPGHFTVPKDPMPGDLGPAVRRDSAPAIPEKIKLPPRPTMVFDKAKAMFTTGRLMSGKDYVLQALGRTVFGFADPLYGLQNVFFGSPDKTLPGAREFLQQVGQWGRGVISPQYPLTTERAMWVQMIRGLSARNMLPPGVDWASYGKNENIWLDALINRVNASSGSTTAVAVSNVRFTNELERLKGAGWEHFHVMCSAETRKERMARAKMDPATDSDISEQMAMQMDADVRKQVKDSPVGPRLRVIWSDPVVPSPSGRILDFTRDKWTTTT